MNPKQAKEHCGYSPKPTLPTCGNCGAFASDLVLPAWILRDFAKDGHITFYDGGMRRFSELADVPDTYKIESKMRCTDHGFATKKMAACKLWRPKPLGVR